VKGTGILVKKVTSGKQSVWLDGAAPRVWGPEAVDHKSKKRGGNIFKPVRGGTATKETNDKKVTVGSPNEKRETLVASGGFYRKEGVIAEGKNG